MSITQNLFRRCHKAFVLMMILSFATISVQAANSSYQLQKQFKQTDGQFIVKLNSKGLWNVLVSPYASYHTEYSPHWITSPELIKNLSYQVKLLGGGKKNVGRVNSNTFGFDGRAFLRNANSVHKNKFSISYTDIYPLGVIQNPQFSCELKKRQLLNSGRSLKEILSRDWVIPVGTTGKLQSTATLEYQANRSLATTKQVSRLSIPSQVKCLGNRQIANRIALQAGPL